MTISAKIHSPRLYRTGVIAFCVVAVSACASSQLPDDAFQGGGAALTMVAVNHTDRGALDVFADKYWAGDVLPQGGGAAATCCYPGLTDWRKPVTIRWTWDEQDAKGTTPARPAEPHMVVSHFPPGGPSRNDDMYKDEANLCIILRDADKAELAFSVTRSGCFDK
jgi:hypothetical protein